MTVSEQKLLGKVIVISGGANGVGKAAAKEFARQGAKVVIGDRAPADETMAGIKANGGEGFYVYTDLLKVADCKNLFTQAYEKYGKIDGFFNYAGITPVSPLDTCDEETFDAVMDTNFKACFFCCQEAIKYMRMNHGGSIVLTGSAHGWGGQKDRCAYACSKGVLRILMEHISHQYASEQIRCNYLTLGWTPTEGEIALRKSQGESEEQLRKRAAACLPMGRMCEVTDYLDALVFMFSDGSSMMTGSTFRMTAGEYI
ncbi:NAD(P)-binding protein [Neocallimastix lanati (nom. inval.)]|jgi:NAD(P)-dependent dehydrogenase (short-subunit alcohol dehydrogenase family)|uniref:NAD(P)-binding protein n=1 Tax=Neocallimastix californiae TaxID=1754190 RepID=A0A1Y2FB41_9FUNG|nr:NAD(P)-binding protein [Neocallimastix sp. JGI-2020a]ORY81138.1 NAD(P)-binding protein [Neocallimastix californiae]|eukprot:ORY81138.1 NAD(P)-binding protein [Neocallimastix californiae]